MARSLTRGEAWQRIGSKVIPKAGENQLPIEYTGETVRALPLGSFHRYDIVDQIPAAVGPDAHFHLRRQLTGVIRRERMATIARGQERKLIPEGTPRGLVNRAYTHASMHALHAFGVIDYDSRMDDHLKSEMKPLLGFMRYAFRRVKDTMLATQKSKWRPYRAEFGQPFPNPKYDKVTGAERLRVRPNQELIKSTLAKASPTHPLTFAALGPHLQHLVPRPDQAIASTGDPLVPPPHPKEVGQYMPLVRVILSSASWSRSPAARRAAKRVTRAGLIADPDVPLSHATTR